MSLTSIIEKYFNTLVTIQRRTNTIDSVGDYTSVWSDLLTDIKASVQPLNNISDTELKNYPQGKEYQADSKAYIPLNSSTELIKEGDRLIDTETSKTYAIVKIEEFKASRATVTSGHHLKLFLEIARKPNS